MSEIAIKLRDITKVYKTYSRPSDRLLEMFFRGRRVYHNSVYALRDVSFDVPRGTTFGILGRNGSGKSTVLQIIAQVLQPTLGSVEVNGRVSALLELGSGFNPEFSGIDNVYLYASILGLGKEEIDAKLPGILEFADIGDFVYQPVKTYSSGMVVRLAFAVAVSIDPDILIVDEALAVGDALFQHKCILRMRQIIESGATVVFVSHDIAVVKMLCKNAILLENGSLVAQGSAEEVAREYHRRLFEEETERNAPSQGSGFSYGEKSRLEESVPELSKKAELPCLPSAESMKAFKNHADQNRFGTGEAQAVFAEILDSKGERTTLVEYGETFTIRLHYQFFRDISSAIAGFILRNSKGVDILVSNSHIQHRKIENVSEGEHVVVDFRFVNTLRDDHYSLSMAVTHEDYFHQARHYDWVDNAFIVRTARPRNTIIYGLYYPTDMEIEVYTIPSSRQECDVLESGNPSGEQRAV